MIKKAERREIIFTMWLYEKIIGPDWRDELSEEETAMVRVWDRLNRGVNWARERGCAG